jgi:hypothetical protein
MLPATPPAAARLAVLYGLHDEGVNSDKTGELEMNRKLVTVIRCNIYHDLPCRAVVGGAQSLNPIAILSPMGTEIMYIED